MGDVNQISCQAMTSQMHTGLILEMALTMAVDVTLRQREALLVLQLTDTALQILTPPLRIV